jgi:hypothetical protein
MINKTFKKIFFRYIEMFNNVLMMSKIQLRKSYHNFPSTKLKKCCLECPSYKTHSQGSNSVGGKFTFFSVNTTEKDYADTLQRESETSLLTSTNTPEFPHHHFCWCLSEKSFFFFFIFLSVFKLQLTLIQCVFFLFAGCFGCEWVLCLWLVYTFFCC